MVNSDLAAKYRTITKAFDGALASTGLDFGTDDMPGRHHGELFVNGNTRSVKIRDREENTVVTAYRSDANTAELVLAIGTTDRGRRVAGDESSPMIDAARTLFAACTAAE